MIDLTRLAILREFAEQGTVGATAAKLSFTPSAISQQLAQLQREAGVELLARHGRRLELTDAGRLLVTRGTDLLRDMERIEAELQTTAGSVRGTVRVGAFQTAMKQLVAPVLPRLAQKHPDLALAVVELEAEAGLPALARGDLDVLVAEEYPNAPRPRSAGITRRDLRRDEMLLALPEGHPAGRHKSVKLAAVADAAWVSAQDGTSYAEMVAGLCRTTGGFEPRIRHRVSDLDLMLELVARTRAVAIVPALGDPEGRRGVAVRRLAGARVSRTIFAAWRDSDEARPSTTAVVAALKRPATL